MHIIFDLCLEPAIDATRVEEMPARGQLPHTHALLEVLKTYHTLVLLKFIHALIEGFLFDETDKSGKPIFLLLFLAHSLLHLPLLLLLTGSYLVMDNLGYSSLSHAYSDDRSCTYQYENSHQNEQDKGNNSKY